MADTVAKILKDKSEQLMNAVDFASEHINDVHEIKLFITRRVKDLELNDRQQEKLAIYNFAYNQLVSGRYTEMEVINLIRNNYSCNGTLALQHLNDTKDLFASIINFNKALELKLLYEQNSKRIRKAEDRGDDKAVAMLEKNRMKIIDMMPDLSNDDNDFVGHEFIAVFDPSLLGIPEINKKDLAELLSELKEVHGGDISLGISDAEIIEESDEEESPL